MIKNTKLFFPVCLFVSSFVLSSNAVAAARLPEADVQISPEFTAKFESILQAASALPLDEAKNLFIRLTIESVAGLIQKQTRAMFKAMDGQSDSSDVIRVNPTITLLVAVCHQRLCAAGYEDSIFEAQQALERWSRQNAAMIILGFDHFCSEFTEFASRELKQALGVQ